MDNHFRPWMLPEGVVEALPEEAGRLNVLEQAALSTFARWGYQPLRPPMLEYADTFIADDKDGKMTEQMIQFKDQKTGRQLGIRPDITLQIARIDAHYLPTDKVSRYAYSGEVVRSYPEGHGSARNPTVTGVELLGSSSWQADVEIVSLLIEYLKRVKLPTFTIALGNVDIVAELLKALSVEEKYFAQFFSALARKDSEKIATLSERCQLSATNRDELLHLPLMYGDAMVLKAATMHYQDYPQVLTEIKHLQRIADVLQKNYPDVDFSFDLSDVHGYGYHNGLIFSAYVSGLWQAVARGGRYDSSGNHFGEKRQSRASIGFNCHLNLLSRLVTLAKPTNRTIACHVGAMNEIQRVSFPHFVKSLREQGDVVIYTFDDATEANTKTTHQIVWREETWVVEPIK